MRKHILQSTVFILALVLCAPALALKKNVAGQKIPFEVVDENGAHVEGAATSITTTLSKDGGAFQATDDAVPTEIGAGWYFVETTREEANADLVILSGVSVTTGTEIIPVVIYTDAENIKSISGDTTAADNLEFQYDTTGLVGDTFPANQSQINQIANVAGVVKRAASGYVLTLGTQSANTVSATEELDGIRHEHTDTGDDMDLYYEFNIGSGLATEVKVTGYLQGNNDDLEVYGFDWVSATWKQIGIFPGKASTSNVVEAFDLLVNMVGSGVNAGLVRVRFFSGAFTLSGATLAIDQILVEFSQGVEGYQNGAVWMNTNASNTNTVRGVDGTATNPVSTIAAVNTLLASTNLSRVEVASQSSFTFAASQENQRFSGKNWTLALGGQSISGSFIEGANITGIGTGASEIHFEHCHFGDATIPPSDLERCVLENTIILGVEGDYFFENCKSGVAGTNTPSLDFGALRNASSVNFRSYSGGIEVQNVGAGTGTYNMSLEGWGQLIVNANCSGGTIAIRGLFTVTDNASGAVTFSDDARFDSVQLISDTYDELLTGDTHNIATSAGRILRELKEQIVYMGIIWINTTGGGSSGAEKGENGTIENPVDNMTDALTLSGLTGIKRFHVSSASSITLVSSLENIEIFNSNWDLFLGGQSLSNSCISGANVSGVATGNNPPKFIDCYFGIATLPPCHIINTSFGGIITAGSAGDFFFEDCKSAIAGINTPGFDYGAELTSSNLNMRHYSGGIEIQNMGAGSGDYKMSLEGFGQLIINANCSASSTIAIRGHFTVTDNASGVVTLSEDARYDVDQINAQADLALSDYDGPTNAEMEAALAGLTTETIANATVETLMADTPGLDGTTTFQDMVRAWYSAIAGKMTRDGTIVSQEVVYFGTDDSTALTTHTITSSGRTTE